MNEVRKVDLTALFYMLFPCLLALISIFYDRHIVADFKEYTGAPSCTARAPLYDPQAPCQVITVTVIGKKYHKANRGSDIFVLTTTQSDGGTRHTSVGPLCYARAALGQSVQAKLWRRDITLFLYPDRSYVTHDDPIWEIRQRPFDIGGTVFICTTLTLFIVVSWRNNRRTAVAQRNRTIL